MGVAVRGVDDAKGDVAGAAGDVEHASSRRAWAG